MPLFAMNSAWIPALLVCASMAAPALACNVPEGGGNTPWRRAVAKVRHLPEVEAWAGAQAREGQLVKYVLSLDSPERSDSQCWWPIEILAEGKTWKRFLVTPDGYLAREAPARSAGR